MKLRAKIQRSKTLDGMSAVRFTFPADRKWPFYIPESILSRNIGPRPYSEGFMTNDNGEKVCMYWGHIRMKEGK